MTSEHLAHGLHGDLVAPDWPAITPAEATAVLAQYAIDSDDLSVAWRSPRPLSSAALLNTEVGQLLLKRHHASVRSVSSLRDEHRFIAHLAESGLNVVRVLAAPDESTAISHGEWTWELHEAAEGADTYRDRESWTGYLAADHVRSAAQTLARLHLASNGYQAARRAEPLLVTGWQIAGSNDPIAQVERRLSERPALANFLSERDWRADFARSVLPLHEHLQPLLDLVEPLWTHGDWHPSNLFWRADNQVSTVIDFGLSDRTSAVIDIATAIERTCVPWLDLGNASIEADIATAVDFVTAYSEQRALSPAECAALPLVLPLVHIDFALSEVDYFVTALHDHDRAAIAYDDFLLAHADWFASPAGRALTDALSALTVSRAD